MGRLLRNRNFIFLLAIVLGLTAGEPAGRAAEPLVLPSLALVMTLSATSVTSRELVSLKNTPGMAIFSLMLNYVLLGGSMLLLASLLISDHELWAGFVVVAAAPSAVATTTFSYVLGGDTLFSLIGLTATYLAGLVVLPLAILVFLGIGFFQPLELLLIMAELVVVPVIVSRVLLATGLIRLIRPWQGAIVNWSLFVATFAIIAENQAFFSDFGSLARMSVIAVATSFLLAYTRSN